MRERRLVRLGKFRVHSHPTTRLGLGDVKGVDVGVDVAPFYGGGGRGELGELGAEGFDVEGHEGATGVGALFDAAETVDEGVLDDARGLSPEDGQGVWCDVRAREFGGETQEFSLDVVDPLVVSRRRVSNVVLAGKGGIDQREARIAVTDRFGAKFDVQEERRDVLEHVFAQVIGGGDGVRVETIRQGGVLEREGSFDARLDSLELVGDAQERLESDVALF